MTDLKKMTPSEVGRLGALARQGKYKAKKRVPKGRKPAQTPEAKEAARRQAAQQKRADVMASFGSFGRQTLPDLEALASGTEISPENADGMVMAGLAERLATGAVVLTRHGRTLYNAASRGDVGKAKEAIDRAEAAAGERMAREKGKPAADDKEAADAEKEKPKGGGGGGGGGKEKPSADDKQREQAAARAQTAQDTSERVGLGKDTLDTLRAAAEEGAEPDDGLVQLGLQDAAGDATDQGRRALAALERGDVRQYRAALQDAQARMERKTAKQERALAQAIAQAERAAQQAGRDAEREAAAAEREAAATTRKRRMDRAEALRVLGETQKTWWLKHGAHDQSSHGRRGARGRASAAAYRGARAGGASVQEARAAARDVSAIYTARQRIANIDKQLEGSVSERQRSSLAAERGRLNQDIETRTARVRGLGSAAMNAGAGDGLGTARNAPVEPTVRGRRPKSDTPAQAAQDDAAPRANATALAQQHGLPAESARYLEMTGSDPQIAELAGRLHAANAKLPKREQMFVADSPAGAVALATQIQRRYGGDLDAAIASGAGSPKENAVLQAAQRVAAINQGRANDRTRVRAEQDAGAAVRRDAERVRVREQILADQARRDASSGGLPPIPTLSEPGRMSPREYDQLEDARIARQAARQERVASLSPPPPIVGSPKQQQFAGDVRRKTLADAEKQRRLFLEEGIRRAAPNLDAELARFDAAIDRLRDKTDARFWLDTARQTPVNTLLRTV